MIQKVPEPKPLDNQRIIYINIQRNNNINNVGILDGNVIDIESGLNQ